MTQISAQRYAAASEQGRMRDHNEDRWCAHGDLGLFVVSDGMGGGPAGELASEIVVRALPAIVTERFDLGVRDVRARDASRSLRAALAQLSARMRDGSHTQPGLAGMGATAVVALIRDDCALIAHIGDSRAYRWRDGRLRRLTRDHSLAQALVDAGEITAREVADHPGHGQLTRHIGMDGEALPEARRLVLRPDDRLLLCTDGLTGTLGHAQLRTILDEHPEPHSACRALVDAALQAGAGDDVTALVVVLKGTGVALS